MADKVVFLTYRCQICGRFLPRTEPFFEGTLELVSGTNQLLDGHPRPEQVKAEIDALVKTIANTDAKTLEEEVYLKRRFRICPSCRPQVLRWLNLEPGK